MTRTKKLVSFAVESQVKFTRLANTHVRQYLSDYDAQTKEIRDYLITIEYPIRFATVAARLEKIIAPYHAKLVQSMQELQDELALYAATLEKRSLKGALEIIDPSKISILETLRKQMFHGAPMTAWVAEFVRNDLRRTVQEVNVGLTYGKSASSIVKSIVTNKQGKGGIRQISRRGLEMLVRSAVQYSISAGRDAVWNSNPKIVRRLLWVSVLDSKTSENCQFYDGKTFAVGKGPRPPAHINCRSTIVPLLQGEKIPAKYNWFDWLNDQPETVQREALGATRFRLWKEARVAPQKFLDAAGEQYTLDELKGLMPAAFARLES